MGHCSGIGSAPATMPYWIAYRPAFGLVCRKPSSTSHARMLFRISESGSERCDARPDINCWRHTTQNAASYVLFILHSHAAWNTPLANQYPPATAPALKLPGQVLSGGTET